MESSRLSTRLVSWALAIAVALGAVPLSFAANICDPSAGTNCAAVNSAATGGGIHTSEYDLRSQFTGQKATYSAATTALTGIPNSAIAFFSICGSGTKTLRIQRFNMNASVGTATTRQAIVIRKTSTATTLGTATALVAVPHDSNSAASTASLVNIYTVAPTAGTLVGTIGTRTKIVPITPGAVGDFIPEAIWDFVGRESEGIVLRGTGQCMEVATQAGAAGITVALAVTWTEE